MCTSRECALCAGAHAPDPVKSIRESPRPDRRGCADDRPSLFDVDNPSCAGSQRSEPPHVHSCWPLPRWRRFGGFPCRRTCGELVSRAGRRNTCRSAGGSVRVNSTTCTCRAGSICMLDVCLRRIRQRRACGDGGSLLGAPPSHDAGMRKTMSEGCRTPCDARRRLGMTSIALATPSPPPRAPAHVQARPKTGTRLPAALLPLPQLTS